MTGRINKSKKEKNFTVVPNAYLRRNDLTWKAKGLMTYLLSLDDDWDVYKSDLSNRSKDGYDSMISAWKELENEGYITTSKVKNGTLFNGYEYYIHESPVRGFPEPEIPLTENPQLRSTSLKEETLSLKTNKKILFEDFWQLYPNKKAKKKAQDKWNKLKESDKEKIMSTIHLFVSDIPFEGYNHPFGSTYLHGQRWNDYELPKTQDENNQNEPQEDISDAIKKLRGW